VYGVISNSKIFNSEKTFQYKLLISYQTILFLFTLCFFIAYAEIDFLEFIECYSSEISHILLKHGTSSQ